MYGKNENLLINVKHGGKMTASALVIVNPLAEAASAALLSVA